MRPGGAKENSGDLTATASASYRAAMTDAAAGDLQGWDRQAIMQVVRKIKRAGRKPTEPHRTAWRILEQLATTPARDRWLAESRLATLAGARPGPLADALWLLTVDIARRHGASQSFIEVEAREGELHYALREGVAPIVRAELRIIPDTD